MLHALLITLSIAAAAPPKADAPPPGLPPCPSGEERPDVTALVRRTEQLLEGRSSVGTMVMNIKTPSYARSLKMKIWSSGEDYALIRILEGGPREVGMMTLKRADQLWNYLPQAGRVMKLPSGMLGDSWLGSDFTNDDLVRSSSMAEDFTSAIGGTVQHQGRRAWQVTLTPKPDAVVVWGKIEMLIDREHCLPLLQTFFDEEGQLARRMVFSDVRKIGWRHFPAKMTVVPAESGRETSIVYEDVQFDVDIPEDTFSLHRLQRGR